MKKKKPGKQSIVSVKDLEKNRFNAVNKSLDKEFGKEKRARVGFTNVICDYGKRYLK